MVKLDILSDPICPWCYIGKANLDLALERNPGHPFDIEWHPFQLNPDMPTGGMNRRAYLAAKFGGEAAVDRADAALQDRADAAGIELNNDLVITTPNTLDAHRLIHWAGIEGHQTAAVSALFHANFVEGRDIGNAEVLADIADAIGLDAAVVARLLKSDEDKQLIRDRDAHSRKMGVSAVPTFIVASQHAVPGAQSTEMWEKVIADITAQLASDA